MRFLKVALGAAALVAVSFALRSAPLSTPAPALASASTPGVVVFVQAPASAQPAALDPDGTESRPFSTIAQALRVAPAGSTVRVSAGTYLERLAITRSIQLVGAGAFHTRLVAPAATGSVVAVVAGNVSIDGLAIEGGEIGVELSAGGRHSFKGVALRGQSEAGLRASAAYVAFADGELIDIASGRRGEGLLVENGRLELTGSILRRAGRRAVLLRHSKGLITDANIEGPALSAVQAVEGSDVEVVGGRFARLTGAALFASRSVMRIASALIERNEMGIAAVRGASIDVDLAQLFDHQIAAIAITAASGSVRRSLLLHGGSDAAIAVSDSVGVSLDENQIVDPDGLGMHLSRAEVSLRGNEIRGARRDRQRDFGDGIFALQSKLTLHGNVLRANAGSGLALSSTTAQLVSNDLLDNGRAGLILLDRSDVTLVENVFTGNRSAGVEVLEQSRAAFRGNRFDGTGASIEEACGDATRQGIARLIEGNTFVRGSRPPPACD